QQHHGCQSRRPVGLHREARPQHHSALAVGGKAKTGGAAPMMLQALLVSKDDQDAETMIHVLAQLGVAVLRSSAADAAIARLGEAPFDQVIVDFEDPETASLMLESCRRMAGPNRSLPISVALLTEERQIRAILGGGAHFVLTKPVTPERAFATLSPAVAILKRE